MQGEAVLLTDAPEQNVRFCTECRADKQETMFEGTRGKAASTCSDCRAKAAAQRSWAKPAQCTGCGKALIVGGRCYECATGRPRVYSPEWCQQQRALRRAQRREVVTQAA